MASRKGGRYNRMLSPAIRDARLLPWHSFTSGTCAPVKRRRSARRHYVMTTTPGSDLSASTTNTPGMANSAGLTRHFALGREHGDCAGARRRFTASQAAKSRRNAAKSCSGSKNTAASHHATLATQGQSKKTPNDGGFAPQRAG